MKNLTFWSIVAILSVILFLAPAAAPVNAGPAKTQAAGAAPVTGGRQNWDSVVAAAKKEGAVSVYATWPSQPRVAVSEAFRARYGINVEFTPFSRGSEVFAKVQAEQRAGLYLADVFGGGNNTSLTMMKPAGMLGTIEPMLVLPDVLDGKNWPTGNVHFVDTDKTSIGMILYLTRDIFYNTDLIKKGEITDYSDILKPQYKGKISMNDPTVTGSGSAFFIHLAVNIWDLAKAKDYLTQLVGPQQAVLERDNRIQVESVARGKYSIGLAPNPVNLASFMNAGAHLDVVRLKQGVRATSGMGAFAVPAKMAHPNAAKLFVNWLLSKEGQTVFSRAFGSPSLRTDVSTQGFNPIFLLQPGEKVFPESEDFLMRTEEVLNMTKQVVRETNK